MLYFEKVLLSVSVKIGYQSCVYANKMHTVLELCTPMGVGVVNRQRQIEAVLKLVSCWGLFTQSRRR